MQENQMTVAMASNPVARWPEEQKALIKRQVAKNATDDELAMFLAFCADQGFNPLTKDVYFVKREGKDGKPDSVAYQTSIDAMRSRAEETGKYAGNDKPVFTYNDKNQLIHAQVTVWKMVEGTRCPFEGEADWEEFYPGDKQGFMWNKMPRIMLGKCAEAQALRKAFPKQLKKVYVKEEMDQADRAIEIQETKQQHPNVVLAAQLKAGAGIVTNKQVVQQTKVVPLPPDNNDIPMPSDEHEANAPENRDESAGAYVITFGKYKGKTIADVGIPQVVSYLAWVQSTAKKTGKPMSQDAQELYLYSKAFAEGKSVQDVEMEGLPI